MKNTQSTKGKPQKFFEHGSSRIKADMHLHTISDKEIYRIWKS